MQDHVSNSKKRKADGSRGGKKMSEELVTVSFKVDPEGLNDMEHLKALLGSPNLATALYNAVSIVNDLYGYKSQGYELRLVKNGDTRRFRLP